LTQGNLKYKHVDLQELNKGVESFCDFV